MKYRTVGFVLALAASAAQGATPPYPDKPVRVIVAVPAGGTPDTIARMVLPGMATTLGQPMVVDNRGGAGGLIGAELAARAVPDGYTLFFSAPGPLTVTPHVNKQTPYDTLKDFAPIGLIATGPFVLMTYPSFPPKTIKELIALAKAQPGKLNYASAGNGASNHLATELFKSMAGVDITHVAYKGAPQATTDVIAGNVNLTFISLPPALAQVKAGRLRILGISSLKRSPLLPDVPSINEAGVPGYEWQTWAGMLAPAKTPRPILARVHAALVQAVRAPELKAQFEALGYDVVASTGEQFGQLIRKEWEKNAKVVKLSGAKVD